MNTDAAKKIRGSVIRRLDDFRKAHPGKWCGLLDDATGAAEVIAQELESAASPTPQAAGEAVLKVAGHPIAALAPVSGGDGMCYCQEGVICPTCEAACPVPAATPTPQAAGVSDAVVERAWDAYYASLMASGPSNGNSREALRAALEDALTAAGSAPEGWQPIETAPKDGSDILVICMGAPQPTATEAHWNGGVWVGCSADTLNSVGEEWVGSIGVFNRATHWMRKPVAPTASPQPGAQEQSASHTPPAAPQESTP